ncbi:uncharacterized protein [Typha latifolia]|uniref:uncharacterized protein n=1 Tax=Typha latifolia TaxID=4733 RepID=UPI003C2C8C07
MISAEPEVGRAHYEQAPIGQIKSLPLPALICQALVNDVLFSSVLTHLFFLSSSSMALESWMAAMAREELQKLETQHPNRFDYLKLELKSLISAPEWDSLFYSEEPTSLPPTSSAATQVSSNRKRKFDGRGDEQSKREWCLGGSKDRVEMVIERAEACLKRIRQVKQSFFALAN